MIRSSGTLRRISGEPSPARPDAATLTVDLRIPRSAAYENKEKAAARIREVAIAAFGGDFEVTGVRSWPLRGRR